MAVRLFISYTHDDDLHCQRVLELADRLGADGFDVHLDRYVDGTPEGGWPAWMERQIAEADFILVVCSHAYYERYRGRGDVQIGLGGRWEAHLLRDALYGDPARVMRCVPVLAPDAPISTIPDPLRFSATRHQLLDGYDGLCRHLRGQSQQSGQDAPPAGSEGTDRFAEGIRERFAGLDRLVERLTEEQYRVIQQLSGQRRALISGCPGSGKTLVAAEKAIRLAHAGVTTLFLCHNPLLAEWVCELTAGSGVRVRAFEDLVAEFSDHAHPTTETAGWTSYSQPTSETLTEALDRLRSVGGHAQAVVVDEGQDFAADWWPLVEACLSDAHAGILYIFFDDRQSLLPYRSVYPIDGLPLNLSRNCRNGGRIYEVMRQLVPQAPLPEEALSRFGDAMLVHRGPGMLADSVEACLNWLGSRNAVDRAVAVLCGGVGFADSILARKAFDYGPVPNWRFEIERRFTQLLKVAKPVPDVTPEFSGIVFTGAADKLRQHLDELSSKRLPTEADVEAVRRAATMFRPSADLPIVSVSKVVWRHADRQAWLHVPGRHFGFGTIVRVLQSGTWASALPAPERAVFAPFASAAEGEIPVYTVGEIKGLERDVVLLVTQGNAPEPLHEAFVGVSRARSLLAVAIDERALATLPTQLRQQAGLTSPRSSS